MTGQQRKVRSVEWYTPLSVIKAARAVLGGIDLDPCSCIRAQANVKAHRYLSRKQDGLSQPWRGRVWCNPPTPVWRWWHRLCEQYMDGDVCSAVFLGCSVELLQVAQGRGPLCPQSFPFVVPTKRLAFLKPTRSGLKPCDENMHGSIIALLPDRSPGGHPSPQVVAFCREFQRFGTVVVPMQWGWSPRT